MPETVDLVLRELTLDDDLAAFGCLVVDAYVALPGHRVSEAYAAELRDVASRVRTDVVIGAWAGGAPAGCVTYVGDATSAHAEDLRDGEASFRMLAVAPTHSRRGVGAALVEACGDRAAAHRRAALFIYSGSWMTGAHGLYERLGFERRPERDWEVGDPADPIRLLGFRRSVPGTDLTDVGATRSVTR